jgi:BirA family transcriptional regulator, biotin operon repressor / biotin---[acetyl-CoA-carboxylase] ligase
LIPKIIHLPETKSTNSYAIELLSKGRPEEGSVIITDHQTAGKGTDTNTWESEKGKNLTFSLILYPKSAADQQFILNKAISLGIYDFLLTELPGQNVSIKWPNDLYIGDKKVCGILIQNSMMGNKMEYMVVGIGLNVNQTVFTSNAPNPVSLKMITGLEHNLEKLLQKLLDSIFERYNSVRHEATRKVENNYQTALYRLGEWHKYLVNETRINSRINGTNAFGQLLLEKETGEIIVCDLKEVKFVI